MFRHALFVVMVAATLVACNKSFEKSDKGAGAPGASPLMISPEDLVTVRSNALTSGPSITGSIQPERRADLRAEVSAVVLQVLKENGEPVKRGDLLVKLDETALRDNLQSAEAAVRAASQALDQANRQLERLKTLRASGMTSAAAFDEAEVRRNSALSELSAAKSRAAQARQQM